MSSLRHLNRDWCAGALMALLGAGAIVQGMRLPIGTLSHTGPGFFPIVMGVLLILMGLLIVVTGPHPIAPEDQVGIDLRGGGFLAAAFFSVFVGALGDRGFRLGEAAAVSAGIAAAGAAVFIELLGVPFPLYHWF
jgi:hypothetical protein